MITLPDTDQIRAARREAEAMTAYPQSCAVAIDHLVDPVTTPKLWAWLNEITHHLHTAHDLEYADHPPERGPVFNPDDPGQQAAVFVYYVGEPRTVRVIRDGSGTRGWSPLHRYRTPADRCDIGDDPKCPGRQGLWGTPLTFYMSVTRGSTIIVIEACSHCFALLTGVAEAGELQARLKGAITDASYKGGAQ